MLILLLVSKSCSSAKMSLTCLKNYKVYGFPMFRTFSLSGLNSSNTKICKDFKDHNIIQRLIGMPTIVRKIWVKNISIDFVSLQKIFNITEQIFVGVFVLLMTQKQ